jgi:hypothetical protein
LILVQSNNLILLLDSKTHFAVGDTAEGSILVASSVVEMTWRRRPRTLQPLGSGVGVKTVGDEAVPKVDPTKV